MQIIYPKLERLEKQMKSKHGRRKMSFGKWQQNREKLQLAKWKHNSTPGYAQF